ncbi:unnamed protein product, partial [Rotaria magnacalcarata]
MLKVSLLSVTKQTLINSSPIAQSYQQQRSLPYPTLPVATSTRNGDGYFSRLTNLSAISEPNIVDLNLVDCMKKIGEFSPNHQKFNGNQRLRKSLLHNLDNGKYITLSDANPMTQTILERVHGSNSMITLRQTSILNNNNIRQNSSDSNSLNGTNSLETNIPRQRHKSNGDEYDDNESTSSESSSTKSSHTIAISLSSSPINKSSAAALRVAASLFHDGKRQLSRLVNRSFLRKNGKKFLHGHNDVVDMDEEEEDGERLLINDGSNGDLKYKSRNLKEQPQFDKTQLLQTIVNAHNGPIWCMKFSPDGQLLATGGQDSLLKVWVLKSAQPH